MGGPRIAAAQPQQHRQAARPSMSAMNRKTTTTTTASASVHSRAQQARRDSFTRSRGAGLSTTNTTSTRRNSNSQQQRPVLGGMTALDLVLIAAAYAVNLIKTLGLAELFDIALKSMWYCATSLPFDFYRRWSLSHPQAPSSAVYNREADAKFSISTNNFRPSQRPHPIAPPPSQLSPFHHLVILITRFACMNFPHLLPRVLFAEDTMLPFVGWRTGGANWELMKEIRGESIMAESSSSPSPSFRAIWMGPDAYASSESRRQSSVSRQASTILYLHGGGFSLGSVSFYAEALLRVLNKVCRLESADPSAPLARCVAVEYDLSPRARFPVPLLQCLRCYAHLIEVERIEASSITLAGDSAGGNLAMAMMLALSRQGGRELNRERDWSKLPMPGKAVLISPWVDLRPSQAHAFAGLRAMEEEKADAEDGAGNAEKQGGTTATLSASHSSREPSTDLTAAINSYEWDYVAAETLLHFAQVYAGILERPRRVMGPLGWIAHLGGILSRGLKEESRASGSWQRSATKGRKKGRSQQMVDPARRLAKAVKDFLEQPLFEHLVSQEELIHAAPPQSTSVIQPSFTSGLAPIFSLEDRQTDAVWKTEDLYFPINSATSSASSDLDTNPMLSPILGDWSKIQLQRGCLVTWGERERMSTDIAAWVELVHSGMGPDDLTPSPDHDRPRQDGEEERERYERRQRGKWLKTAVEHGSGGVHAWPFVAMYLAGSDDEREKGLELLARFIARPVGGIKDSLKVEEAVSSHFPNIDSSYPPSERPSRGEHSSPPYSPGSLPSDIGEDMDEDEVGEPADGSQSPMFTSRGGGRAFTEEEFKEAMGLSVQYGREYIPPASQSSSRVGMATVVPVTSPPPTHLRTLFSPSTPPTRISQQGRSEGLSSPSSSSTSSSPATSTKGSISRRMEREYASGLISRGRKKEPNPSPLWWTKAPAAEAIVVQPEAVEGEISQREKEGSGAGSRSRLAKQTADDAAGGGQRERGEELLLRLSPPALPTSSASGASSSSSSSPSPLSPPPSSTAVSGQQLNESYFGLSYALRREAEEGLSDIAEESSVMSSGFASIGENANAPPGVGAAGVGSTPQYHQLQQQHQQHQELIRPRYADDDGSLPFEVQNEEEEDESAVYSPYEEEEQESILRAMNMDVDQTEELDSQEEEEEEEEQEEEEYEQRAGYTATIGRSTGRNLNLRRGTARTGEAWWSSGRGAL